MESADKWAVKTFAGAHFGACGPKRTSDQDGKRFGARSAGILAQTNGRSGRNESRLSLLRKRTHQLSGRLIAPHLEQTRALMQKKKRILLVQDMTDVDYRHHPQTSGLGPVGRQGKGQGYLLQTVLAIEPRHERGSGHSGLRKPFCANVRRWEKRACTEPTQGQRIAGLVPASTRERTSPRVASTSMSEIEEVISFPSYRSAVIKAGTSWCGSIMIGGWTWAWIKQETAVPPRSVDMADSAAALEPCKHLFEEVPNLAEEGGGHNPTRRQPEAPATRGDLSVSWGELRLWPPDGEAGNGSRSNGRHGGPNLGSRGARGSRGDGMAVADLVAVGTEEQAWERVAWYRMRSIVEDPHQCLKTGCQIETRQLQTYQGLRTLLGFLAPLAVRLLHLRNVARQDPQRLAQEILPPDVVRVVAHLAKVAPQLLTSQSAGMVLLRLVAIWAAKGTESQDGKPSGRDGCISKLFSKASISLLNSPSNRKLWVKDRDQQPSLRRLCPPSGISQRTLLPLFPKCVWKREFTRWLFSVVF